MLNRVRVVIGGMMVAACITACNTDVSPTGVAVTRPAFQGGSSTSIDTTLQVGGAGGGGGGGGGQAAGSCGTLSANITTYKIFVYTTRIGIGFSGTATNCGARNVAFEVVVTDVNPNVACRVAVPHFLAARNTAPGVAVNWNANSTLVNCMNTTHTFRLTLVDTNTGQTLDTQTVSAFL